MMGRGALAPGGVGLTCKGLPSPSEEGEGTFCALLTVQDSPLLSLEGEGRG
jgi:hypothetical protein